MHLTSMIKSHNGHGCKLVVAGCTSIRCLACVLSHRFNYTRYERERKREMVTGIRSCNCVPAFIQLSYLKCKWNRSEDLATQSTRYTCYTLIQFSITIITFKPCHYTRSVHFAAAVDAVCGSVAIA